MTRLEHLQERLDGRTWIGVGLITCGMILVGLR